MSDINTLRMADFKPLMEYLRSAPVEEAAEDPDSPVPALEIWDASQDIWVLKRTTDVISIRPADFLLLVRNPAVPNGNGMGGRIAAMYECSFMQWAAELQDLPAVRLPRYILATWK